MTEFEEKLQAIIDDYASSVDDDSTYFVKREIKNKYRNAILQLFNDEVIGRNEKKPREKESTGYMKFEVRNTFRDELREKLGGKETNGKTL